MNSSPRVSNLGLLEEFVKLADRLLRTFIARSLRDTRKHRFLPFVLQAAKGHTSVVMSAVLLVLASFDYVELAHLVDYLLFQVSKVDDSLISVLIESWPIDKVVPLEAMLL